ncbi:MAG: hypothetical protein WCC58_09660 [Burkholderiales bacterium]
MIDIQKYLLILGLGLSRRSGLIQGLHAIFVQLPGGGDLTTPLFWIKVSATGFTAPDTGSSTIYLSLPPWAKIINICAPLLIQKPSRFRFQTIVDAAPLLSSAEAVEVVR